ncbi:YbaB/EbfC family nucleoid-associated protein [uncultured Jatrophihabitans sp.]|uniref:YbaB/EbfC family nucleoid-associated protein n=1 Tax=uncultured Jatrophihabitans sp. TaxID=1610747 RepID=UPI0035CB3419
MSADLDDLIARARTALAEGGATDVVESEAGTYVGTAADGLVRVEVSAVGRLTSLQIDPQLFDGPLEDVADAARSAINVALDRRPGQVDFAPVIDVVRATQVQARRQLDEITRGIADVTGHVQAARPATSAEAS